MVGNYKAVIRLTNVLMAVLLVLSLNSLVTVGYYANRVNSKLSVDPVVSLPTRLMIIAAHQDDAVIQAGGLAARNIRSGGGVNIVYLTVSREHALIDVRKSEAVQAWSLAGVDALHLKFLGLEEDSDWSEATEKETIEVLRQLLREYAPETVVIPLLEGGNVDHDRLNLLAKDALTEFPNIRVLEAAEYNPYLKVEYNPQKVIWFLVRLLPFSPVHDPNLGLIRSNQVQLDLDEVELSLKRTMLEVFESQAGVISVDQFGYADLFESMDTNLPKTIIIQGKHMSWPTAVLLGLLLVTCFALGFRVGLGRAISPYLVGIAFAACVLTWYFAADVGKENLVFVTPFLAGALIAEAVTLVLLTSRRD